MTVPEVLDLCCCSGGAGHGYALGGMRPTGVDNIDRPRYPYRLIVADALAYLGEIIRTGEVRRYSLIHASPPCQAACTLTVGTNASRGWGGRHLQLIPQLRTLLNLSGVPYVIEQPVGKAPIRMDVVLCMDMWPVTPPRVFRHRAFELGGWSAEAPPAHVPHSRPHAGVPAERRRVRGYRGRHGDTPGYYADGDYVAVYGNGGSKATIGEAQHALGIDWTDEREELNEAVPPAYTRWMAGAFLSWQANRAGLLVPEAVAA